MIKSFLVPGKLYKICIHHGNGLRFYHEIHKNVPWSHQASGYLSAEPPPSRRFVQVNTLGCDRVLLFVEHFEIPVSTDGFDGSFFVNRFIWQDQVLDLVSSEPPGEHVYLVEQP